MSDGFELALLTDIQKSLPEKVEFNYEEAVEWVAGIEATYQNLAVTNDKDSIATAKETKANINRVAKGLSDWRISIKKDFLKPFETFEGQCKELTNRLTAVSGVIDAQLKEIENAERREKMDGLKAFFEQETADIEEYLAWERVANDKWGNKTFRIEDAQDMIRSMADATRNELEVIRSLESPFETELLETYRETHDLRRTMEKNNALKARKSAEEQRKAAEVAADFEDGYHGVGVEEPVYQTPIRPVDAPEPEKMYRLCFEVEMNLQQANALKAFFLKSGIKYRKIQK